MKIRNFHNNGNLEQRNKRRREESRSNIVPEDNNDACDPSFRTSSKNDIQSATNPSLKSSVRGDMYCDANKSYEKRSDGRRNQRSWGYEKRYNLSSHRVWDYDHQVDSRDCDPSVGISSLNSTMPRKNPPQMWNYDNRCVGKPSQRIRDYECQVDNGGRDPSMGKYSRIDVRPVTHPRQTWDYDKRHGHRWMKRRWNNERQVDNPGSDPSVYRYSTNEILPAMNPHHQRHELRSNHRTRGYDVRYKRERNQRNRHSEGRVDNKVSDPDLHRSSSNTILPVTNPSQISDHETGSERKNKHRKVNEGQVDDRSSDPSVCITSSNSILPVTNPPGISDHEMGSERKKKHRKVNEDQVDDRSSDPSVCITSSNSILPVTNPPGISESETRSKRKKKDRKVKEGQVDDRSSDPSVHITSTNSILPVTNPSVEASVKGCTNIEPIVSQHLEVTEDNQMESAPISVSEAVKDETGVSVGEDTISQQGNSSEEVRLTVQRRKKLIILDVNGLLADFVPCVPIGYKPDVTISRKGVFKRPFCDDFLRFCFEHFEVGVWSSRVRKNVDTVVDFLMGDLKHKLLFCWDQSHCTRTGLSTVENESKPLVLKELQKIWEKFDPGLPWEKGEFNESNTLLLDDSPYKALRNPANTSIFPHSYSYKNPEDASLGPGGDLRVYLEGLATAENVKKYIEQNPFGQSPITELNPSWGFYRQIVHPGTVKEKRK